MSNHALTLAERLKDSMLPLLIEGETGVGKELFAEAIHEMSARSAGPLVSFDRSLAPEQAGDALQSAFEQAHGGTLIIDEPSELPQLAQARLHQHDQI